MRQWNTWVALFILSQIPQGLAFSQNKPREAKASASPQANNEDSTRRRLLSAVGTAVLGSGLVTSSPSNANAVDLGGVKPVPKNIVSNKRLGGLANKIRGVCNNMVGQ